MTHTIYPKAVMTPQGSHDQEHQQRQSAQKDLLAVRVELKWYKLAQDSLAWIPIFMSGYA